MRLISWIQPRGSETDRNYDVMKAHILSGNSNVHARLNVHVQAYVPDHKHVHDCFCSFHFYFSFNVFIATYIVHVNTTCSFNMQHGYAA